MNVYRSISLSVTSWCPRLIALSLITDNKTELYYPFTWYLFTCLKIVLHRLFTILLFFYNVRRKYWQQSITFEAFAIGIYMFNLHVETYAIPAFSQDEVNWKLNGIPNKKWNKCYILMYIIIIKALFNVIEGLPIRHVDARSLNTFFLELQAQEISWYPELCQIFTSIHQRNLRWRYSNLIL